MAKEMKSNFGSHRSKSIGKAGSTGQASGGNSSSFGLGIPHLPQQDTNQTLEQDSIRPSSSPSDSDFSNVEVDPTPPFPPKGSRSNIRVQNKRTFDMDEDPYGPMSSHFYPGGRPSSQSVLTSPTCAYHAGQHAAISGPISGSSADIRHYGVKHLNSRANRQYQSGTDLHGQG